MGEKEAGLGLKEAGLGENEDGLGEKEAGVGFLTLCRCIIGGSPTNILIIHSSSFFLKVMVILKIS